MMHVAYFSELSCSLRAATYTYRKKRLEDGGWLARSLGATSNKDVQDTMVVAGSPSEHTRHLEATIAGYTC